MSDELAGVRAAVRGQVRGAVREARLGFRRSANGYSYSWRDEPIDREVARLLVRELEAVSCDCIVSCRSLFGEDLPIPEELKGPCHRCRRLTYWKEQAGDGRAI